MNQIGHFISLRSRQVMFISKQFRRMSSVKTGILMLNMGGPRTTAEVDDFLLRLFTDRDIIQLPKQNILGPWIAKRRTESIKRKYSEIGGGSPIFQWTDMQGTLLCEKLNKLCPDSAPHKHYVAFRYAKPLSEEALKAMEEQEETGIKWSIIDRWATNKYLIQCFADNIRKELDRFPEHKQKDVVLLFSAHSLPLKQVNKGDPYPAEVGATVNLVMQEMQFCNPYRLVWQSKVGPMPWLAPSTKEAIKGLVQRGRMNMILVPITFTNEHIETLHELDIEYIEDWGNKIGAERIGRCPSPNDHPLFIEALVDEVKRHLDTKHTCSEQFLTNCPLCDNAACFSSKKWFRFVTRTFK